MMKNTSDIWQQSTQDGGAGEMPFARIAHDDFIERQVFPAVDFAEEDSRQNRTSGL